MKSVAIHLCHSPLLHSLPQNGGTAVLVAALFGHKGLVQELCETFGADVLHRMKVRSMQTVSGSDVCMCPIIMCGCTHSITSAGYSAVCV